MDAAVLSTAILIAAGVLFFGTELTIGSDGSLSLMGIVCWLGAAWSAWDAWSVQFGWNLWIYLLFVFLGLPLIVGGMLAVFPDTPAGRKLFPVPDPDEIQPESEEATIYRESFIGELAKTESLMNPGGLIAVDGERHHAETEGLPIEPGQVVQIVDIRSNRFVVRLFEGTNPTDDADTENKSAD